MGKSVHNDVIDAALEYIQTNCDLMVACSTEPTTYAEATSTYALADVAMASGDFTVADDTSGRKVTVGAKTGVTVDSSGTYGHVALVDTGNSKLLYVTTGTSQSLTAGNTIDFPSWKINLQDPT